MTTSLENIENIKKYHDIFDIFDILIFSKISWYFQTMRDAMHKRGLYAVVRYPCVCVCVCWR